PRNPDQGIGNQDRANMVPADENGLAFSRRPGQVINIVTLGGGERGGFFPNGLNGAINGTQLG
ncbi:MAG: ferritin-like domain-containing protein, partial [Pseudomonadota bacterium]|nr:ferritin-like domain-containing protein [Pseudomonadota bacterium]